MKELLLHFTTTEYPNILSNSQIDHYVTCSGQIAVFFPKKVLGYTEYSEFNNKTKRVLELMDNKFKSPVFVDIADLKVVEEGLPRAISVKEEQKTCSKCEGSGECECCGATCSQCDGEGTVVVKGDKTLESWAKPSSMVKIGNSNCAISWHNIEKLIFVAEHLNLERFLFHENDKSNKPCIFEAKDGILLYVTAYSSEGAENDAKVKTYPV